MRKLFLILSAVLAVSCSAGRQDDAVRNTRYARYFDIPDSSHVVMISPYTGESDTVLVAEPMKSIVCMSTSHVAYLDAIGKDSVIKAVSGLSYVSSKELRSRDDVYDIGYDPEIGYERILSLNPDAVLAYSVSAVTPQYVAKLESLGIRVLVVNDHLEDHPLARAEYIRLLGFLTGTMDRADSVFSEIEDRYLSLAAGVATGGRKKVLFNLPYDDQWFIPGEESYMSRLVRDAGGEVLGSVNGTSESGVVSLEQAFMLARDADIWLHPGTARTRRQIEDACHIAGRFGIDHIYNNTLRTGPEGGNDFWESGAARPDLVLEDLVRIMAGEHGSFNYYIEVD